MGAIIFQLFFPFGFFHLREEREKGTTELGKKCGLFITEIADYM